MEIDDLEFHPEARKEFIEAVNWYAEAGSSVQNQLQTRLLESLDFILNHPLGSTKYKNGTRKTVVKQFPYLIFYR